MVLSDNYRFPAIADKLKGARMEAMMRAIQMLRASSIAALAFVFQLFVSPLDKPKTRHH